MPSKFPFSSLKGLTCCVPKLKLAFRIFASPHTQRNGRGRFSFSSCKSRTDIKKSPLWQRLCPCVYTHLRNTVPVGLQRLGNEKINRHGTALSKRNTCSKTPCLSLKKRVRSLSIASAAPRAQPAFSAPAAVFEFETSHSCYLARGRSAGKPERNPSDSFAPSQQVRKIFLGLFSKEDTTRFPERAPWLLEELGGQELLHNQNHFSGA